MKAQFGFIGNREWEKALEEAEWKLDKKNIWVEQPHQGNLVKGYTYNDLFELAEDAGVYIETFNSRDEFIEIVDRLEIEDEIVLNSDLKKGFIYSTENSSDKITSDITDIYSVIKDGISDGRGVEYFTKSEAIEALNNRTSETLAIWLIS